MNPTIKKLICEDSDFAEPQTLQNFWPFIANAKDLANYLVELGFINISSSAYYPSQNSIYLKYKYSFKIEPKHTKHPRLRGYIIRTYTESLFVFIKELSSNVTRIHVMMPIPYPSRNPEDTIDYSCFYKTINNTQLQNFAYLMENVLTYIDHAQKYIDSGKGLWALAYDIQDVLKPLNDAEIKNQIN
jgi:hypothetical protein